jgi:hypothetical protein
MIVFDSAANTIQAVAVGLVDAYDAHPAFDGERAFRRLGTMCRNLQRAVDYLAWGEGGIQAAVEPIATQVLSLGHQERRGARHVELDPPTHTRPVSPTAITLVQIFGYGVGMIG